MAFFLKLAVFSVWAVIMAAVIIGSIQGTRRMKRRRRQEETNRPLRRKSAGIFPFRCYARSIGPASRSTRSNSRKLILYHVIYR